MCLHGLLDDEAEIPLTPDALDLHPRRVPHTTVPDVHNVVLLQGVALARDVGRHLLARGEPHQHALPIGRIWFPGFFDQSFQNNSFQHGISVAEGILLPFFFGESFQVHLLERFNLPNEPRHDALARVAELDVVHHFGGFADQGGGGNCQQAWLKSQYTIHEGRAD